MLSDGYLHNTIRYIPGLCARSLGECVTLAIVKLFSAFLLLAVPLPGAEVSMGHLHIFSRNVPTQRLFLVNVLGGKDSGLLGDNVLVRFPDVLILVKGGDPVGGTVESTVQHVGFKVKSLDHYRDKLGSAGLKFEENAQTRQINVLGPDGIKIELTEDTTLKVPIVNHHIHFYTADITVTQAWYVKTFGAVAGKRGKFEAADLPGVNLSFSSGLGTAPTKGRSLDHIAFQVKDLENFCRTLEAQGVKFESPYKTVPSLGMSNAFLKDPFGTLVELTEGLK